MWLKCVCVFNLKGLYYVDYVEGAATASDRHWVLERTLLVRTVMCFICAAFLYLCFFPVLFSRRLNLLPLSFFDARVLTLCISLNDRTNTNTIRSRRYAMRDILRWIMISNSFRVYDSAPTMYM